MISAENTAKLQALRGRFAGRRCFIIGNGPSLKAADLERIHARGDITLASNKIFLIFPQTTWRPTYYLIGDRGIAQSSGHEIAGGFSGNVLYADYLKDNIAEKARHASFVVLPEYEPKAPRFSSDFARGINRGATITYTAMQVAHWLGISEAYLLGVDFDYTLPNLRPSKEFAGYNTYTPGTERNYFVEGYVKPNEVVVAPNLENSLYAYQAAQRFAAAAPNFKIFNATRGGRLEVFPRVDFDAICPPRAEPVRLAS